MTLPTALRIGLLLVLALVAAPAALAEESSRSIGDPPAEAATRAVGELLEGVAQTAGELRQTASERADATGVFLTPDDAIALAEGNPEIAAWLDDHPNDDARASFDEGSREWEVSFTTTEGEITTTIAVAIVVDQTSVVRETRTDHQVAWMMARGYEGGLRSGDQQAAAVDPTDGSVRGGDD